MNLEGAAAYARRHGLEALLVLRDGDTLFETFGEAFDAHRAHALYSGTKSFWGPLALAAQGEGLLDLDEPVGATFSAWSAGAKSRVTLRHLLTLTSGIGFGGLGNAVPIYERALAVDLKNEPGSTFTYGGIPLQVFGAVLAAKLAPQALTPHEYLARRIFAPIGLEVERWRSLADGTKPLPTGAFLSASQWAKFGRFALENASLAPCFAGTAANPKYGLGWWLAEPANPLGVVYASGSGGQAMYLVRRERLVVVKFARGSSYKHETFLRRLLD